MLTKDQLRDLRWFFLEAAPAMVLRGNNPSPEALEEVDGKLGLAIGYMVEEQDRIKASLEDPTSSARLVADSLQDLYVFAGIVEAFIVAYYRKMDALLTLRYSTTEGNELVEKGKGSGGEGRGEPESRKKLTQKAVETLVHRDLSELKYRVVLVQNILKAVWEGLQLSKRDIEA